MLDNIVDVKKLYLKNDFILSVNQLIGSVNANENYSTIVIIGQKPSIKSLYIERYGKYQDEVLETNYNIYFMEEYFLSLGYKMKISNNAGNYLCNNIYYNCLKYLKESNLVLKVVFMHIPKITNCFDLKKFADDLIKYLINKS